MIHLPILCYHKVGPESEEGRYLNISPETLGQHIGFFKRRGYQFLLARELGGEWSPKSVCLTFDDAYVSTLNYGVEVMVRAEVRASIYAVAGKLGGTSDWDARSQRPLAPADSLAKAHQLGFEIGNHTKHHARMSDLGFDEQRTELRECHDELLKLGMICRSAALPYGAFNLHTREAIARSGYEVGLGLSRRQATSDDDRCLLPRIVVGFGDSLPLLMYKLFIRPRLGGKPRPHYIP